MAIATMKYQIHEMNVTDIIPYKNNPRNNELAVKRVAESIREFGFKVPIVLDKNYEIVAGHTRLKAALELGLKTVPCIIANDLTDAQIKAFRLADNKTAELAEWNLEMLNIELEELNKLELNFSMADFGFDLESMDEQETKETTEDDFDADKAVAEIETPISQRGDVWQLGKHRLMCGDSTSSEDMAKLMDGQECDLVLTDPPYNVDYQGATKDKLKIQNDKMDDDKFLAFLTDAFTRMYEHSKKGAAIYVFHADSEGYNFRAAFKHAGYTLRQCLVWAKNSMVLGRQDYQWKHEPVLYGWKDGASHHWYSDRKQTTVVEFDKPHRNSTHPTIKPLGLVGYFIGNSSKTGDIVLDPFGGSGSTIISCEQTGRIGYSAELDPKYVDVIVKRYIEHKGGSDDVYLIRNGEKEVWKDIKQA
ncbi:DNA adenine methyltransferase YhdJ [Desulfosporosinus acididurans]|uniref:Methyltransferase n=1 Tax=Desulfosporosinus acididurans TaxID=476652 RepID=A0A0J1FQD1_9FIRM|nr:DNA modification methylase [Desulfosporosinus acididurans]KLU65710.1 DNA adenine methyltransferase YhdJ [Desulfosporosinus acididurans]